MKHEYTPDPKGLYQKYIVHVEPSGVETDPDTVIRDAFVLRPQDPHARVAMAAYAMSVSGENPQLSADLRALVDEHHGESTATSMQAIDAAAVMLMQHLVDAQGDQMKVVISGESDEPKAGVFVTLEPELTQTLITVCDAYADMKENPHRLTGIPAVDAGLRPGID